MQTNVTCSLPRKGKFPDQKLSVLLVVPDLAKRPAPRLKHHAFPSPPTGVYSCLAAGTVWLPLFFPVIPLLVGPAFGTPWCLLLLRLTRRISTPGLFLRRHIFWSFFCTSHVEQILNRYVVTERAEISRAQAAVLAARLSACRSTSDRASRNI